MGQKNGFRCFVLRLWPVAFFSLVYSLDDSIDGWFIISPCGFQSHAHGGGNEDGISCSQPGFVPICTGAEQARKESRREREKDTAKVKGKAKNKPPPRAKETRTKKKDSPGNGIQNYNTTTVTHCRLVVRNTLLVGCLGVFFFSPFAHSWLSC